MAIVSQGPAAAVTKWMAGLFGVGAALFMVAGAASLFSSADWIGITFVCGSVGFTTGSLAQLVAASEIAHRRPPGRGLLPPLRPRAWLPARIDFLGAAIQLPGTILFNINTAEALDTALSTEQAEVRVWAPDAIGSVLFLLSALLAFANAEHRWLSWRPRDLDWWIAGLNLAGSVGFGIAAIAAFERSANGTGFADQLANASTALGAACFLAGAILLVPQAERQERARQRS